MAADIGKVFENEMKKVFDVLKESHLVAVQRFSDTGAAGSVVAEQPSDYLVGLPEGCINLHKGHRLMFLEVKASEKHATLQKAAVKPSQRGAVARFRYLLNIPYLILFWDTQRGVLQLWDGIAIMDDRLSKVHMLAEWSDCGTINRLRRDFVAQRIIEYFQIPAKAVTLAKVR